MSELRPYQAVAFGRIDDAFASGHRRVLFVSPTASGKTVTFAAYVAARRARGQRVLIVAHRKELLDQSAAKVRAAGVDDVAIFRGGKVPTAGVVVASIQALRAGLIPADFVVIDEAHHCPADSYARLLEWYPEADHLGATATPWWGAGKGLGDYFQAVVVAETVRGLTDIGYLARARVFTHPHTLRDLDLRGVKSQAGDFAPAALSERVDRPTLIGDIVEHWQTHAGGARTLCFAASVGHSRHIVARFVAAGVAAEHLDGQTPAAERTAILARLESGATLVVSNFNVLTEGFDAPAVGCVILARPTKRAAVYLQAVGRGMRVVDGKTAFVVLDHGGACLMHGLPDREREVRLTGIEPSRGGGLPVRRCPACGIMVPLGSMTCPECSTELRGAVPTEEPSGVLVEVAGPRTLTLAGRSLTVPQWAQELGISESLIYLRLQQGLSAELALAPLSKPPVRRVAVGGAQKTARELSQMSGVCEETIRLRLIAGATPEEAMAPVRTATTLSHNGRTMAVELWAKEIGISSSRIFARLRAGMSTAEALAPPHAPRIIEFNGKAQVVSAWARELGMPPATIRGRAARGLPLDGGSDE